MVRTLIEDNCKYCPFTECRHPLKDKTADRSYRYLNLCPYYKEKAVGSEYTEKGVFYG